MKYSLAWVGILLLGGCQLPRIAKNPNPELQMVNSYQCQIVDLRGRLLKKIGGNVCDYFEDGRVIATAQKYLRLISPNGAVEWQRNINCHHQIHILDQNRFVVLNSSFHHLQKEWLRFDRVSLYNAKGEELRYFDFFEKIDELKKILPKNALANRGQTYEALRLAKDFLNVEGAAPYHPALLEISHANSVYQISPNSRSAVNEAFKPGNFIINANGIGLMFIVDKDLDHILWSAVQPNFENGSANVHDVQVTKNGDLLYYNNNFSANFSSIELMNPETHDRKILFQGTPENKFRGASQGGVQILESGNLLISQFNIGKEALIFEVTPGGEIVNQMRPREMGLSGQSLAGLQEVKQMNLFHFLRNNQSLF